LAQKIEYVLTRNFLLNLANTIMLRKNHLDELDAACGDGDLGVGMYIGFENVKKAIEQKKSRDIGDLLDTAGRRRLRSTFWDIIHRIG